MHIFYAHDRGKHFVVVDPVALGVAFGNKPGFGLLNASISLKFEFVDPPGVYSVLSSGEWDKFPDAIGYQRVEFVLHCLIPE